MDKLKVSDVVAIDGDVRCSYVLAAYEQTSCSHGERESLDHGSTSFHFI